MTHSQITSFLWSVADLIRDTFKRGKYQDVILPPTVLRRIDQVLEPTKGKVLKTYSEYKGKLDNPDDLLRKASDYAFYNTSLFTFERLVDDPQNIAHNLRTYIQSFSPNMREVIEKFDFDNTITKLDDAGLLFQVMEKFAQVDRVWGRLVLLRHHTMPPSLRRQPTVMRFTLRRAVWSPSRDATRIPAYDRQ